MCYRNLLPFQRWHFPLWPCFEMISPSQQSRNLEVPRSRCALVRSLQRAGSWVRAAAAEPGQAGLEVGRDRPVGLLGFASGPRMLLQETWCAHYPNQVTDGVIALCRDWKGEGCQWAWVMTGSSWITYVLLHKGCQPLVLNHYVLSVRLRLKCLLLISINNVWSKNFITVQYFKLLLLQTVLSSWRDCFQ